MGVWDYVPLQKDSSRSGTTSFMAELCLGVKARWKPTLHTHFVNEERHKAIFAKLDVKKQDL